MNENELLARIGRQTLQIENQSFAYFKLLAIFSEVIAGKIDPKRVLVNLTEQTWTVVAEGDRPVMPATVNGVPNCVIAPDPIPTLDELMAP